MKALIQRVSSASVEIDGKVAGAVSAGLLILLGVSAGDTEKECAWLAEKCVNLRVFEDAAEKMNLSLLDTGGAALIISQFTLCASCERGRRPDFMGAAKPDEAIPLYESFVAKVKAAGIRVETGVFGANMNVSLVNQGPVTIMLETPSNLKERA